jgi:hypothetical protein
MPVAATRACLSLVSSARENIFHDIIFNFQYPIFLDQMIVTYRSPIYVAPHHLHDKPRVSSPLRIFYTSVLYKAQEFEFDMYSTGR